MRKLLTLIISVISLNSIVLANNKDFKFTPNQPAYITFIVENINDTHAYSLIINEMLPYSQQSLNVDFNEPASHTKAISINTPVNIIMYSGNNMLKLFVIPNDTLTVKLDYSKGPQLNEMASFSGTTGSICNYLNNVRQHHYKGPRKEQSIEDFNQQVELFYNNQQHKLDSVQKANEIPAWFYQLEAFNINMEAEFNKANQFLQRGWMHNQYLNRDVSFTEHVNFNNQHMCWLESSIEYLGSLKPVKFDSLLQYGKATDEIFFEYLQSNIDIVSSKIKGYGLAYYVASRLSVTFFGNKLLKLSPAEFNTYTQQVDELILNNKHLITDSTIYNFLITEKERKYSQYHNQNQLITGADAPNFYLRNVEGVMKNLEDFKGKVIFINFWATYCVPCINSIPQKNDLAEEFKESDFILLNICLDTDFEQWNKIIETKHFKGEHLICKGQWKENLTAKYNIYGIPHYTIIGKDGKVLANKVNNEMHEIIRKAVEEDYSITKQ